ncbi:MULTISPECIES: flagellin [unclassified Bacillus (in: firmicutes)]|uniref:flagellin N-terminal helical domain-containing protein n=1 Tax=unclassified Bacillus (in: firmicutes) TaxID=185979 RepID=UPI001BE725D4|nr:MULTISPECIES: flagellin [unclassified Bacillus (in: firmicutes)]MBT2615155.1 flagellin [Bacillus sp. ISL-78]MBT2628232.1 flagellin [Bacillus sp. ISL-101]
MIINHNITALNTHRQLGSATNAQGKSMEKLASGMRINRAGDDAAGLAISEKMRGQIRGLDQASRNAQDGISLIQTAEGALNETHDILQRMRELAVQAGNDTNTVSDRGEIQKEVDQLAKEITRIGETTEFNTKNLLDGSFNGKFQIGANSNQNIDLGINDMRGSQLGVVGDARVSQSATVTKNGTVDFTDGTYEVSKNGANYELLDVDGNVVAKGTDGKTFTANTGEKNDTIVFEQVVDSGRVTISAGGTKADGEASISTTLQAGDYTVDNAAKTLKDRDGNIVASSTDNKTFKDAKGNTVLDLDAATTKDLTINIGGIDVSSQKSANNAITKINDALESVSAERAKLGAHQNRLEHTINNLGTSSENLTAAESRIRDVDYALAA